MELWSQIRRRVLGGELSLRREDIDLEARRVRFHRTLEEIKGVHRLKTPKTKKGKRAVLVSNATAAALREHLGRTAGEGFGSPTHSVFCDTQGGWLRRGNFLRDTFGTALKRAGVKKVRPYDLRHTSATLLLLKGANVKMVSERLGHESIEITLKHYAHVLPAMQERPRRSGTGFSRMGTKWAPTGRGSGGVSRIY